MATHNGHQKLLAQLQADGLTTMFGNPGSSEEGLLDEIGAHAGDPLHPGPAGSGAGAASPTATPMATQQPRCVQLHCSVGVGNALGSLYHAFRKQRAPLVVIAGEASAAADAMDAHMALDLVALARPVTKYAARAIHPGSVLRLLRRCIKMAATPPYGPTFLAVPQDILDAPNDEPVVPTVVPETRVAPEPALIGARRRMLVGAENPVIIMGDGVAHAQAQAELAAAGGNAGRRRVGGHGVRAQHPVDAPALPRPHRPHVRDRQPADGPRRRRGASSSARTFSRMCSRCWKARSGPTPRSSTSTSSPTRSPRTTRSPSVCSAIRN